MASVASRLQRGLPAPVKLAGQQRQDPCPSRIAFWEGLRGGLQRLHSLFVHRADAAGEPPRAGENSAGKPVGVAEILGEAISVEQSLAMLGVPDLALGLPQAYQQLAAQ